MGNRTPEEASRNSNFNTLNRSNRSKREERRQKQRKVLVLICLVFILLLCLYLFLIFSQIASTARNNRGHREIGGTDDSGQQTDESDDTGTKPLPPVEGYVARTYNASDVHVGNLVQLDRTSHAYDANAFKNALMNLKKIPQSGTPLKIHVEGETTPDRMMPETLDALTAMFTAMNADGLTDLTIVNAYKAEGNYLPYHTGYAVGLKIYVGNNAYRMFTSASGTSKPEYGDWLLENSCKYGFLIADRDDGVEQAFRYYGIPHATYMKKNGIDEVGVYLNILRTTTSQEGTHLRIEANGNVYETYYVPAAKSGTISVLVPDGNDTVTISGDNEGGFIVTYQVQ